MKKLLGMDSTRFGVALGVSLTAALVVVFIFCAINAVPATTAAVGGAGALWLATWVGGKIFIRFAKESKS